VLKFEIQIQGCKGKLKERKRERYKKKERKEGAHMVIDTSKRVHISEHETVQTTYRANMYMYLTMQENGRSQT